MNWSKLVSRRSFLRNSIIGGLVLSAGCTEMGVEGGINNQRPVILGEIELVNGHDEPHTVTVLVLTPEEFLYLGTHDLQAHSDMDQADVRLIDGPWQGQEGRLTMYVVLDGESTNGITTEAAEETKRVDLNTSSNECIQVSVYIDSSGLMHISENTAGEPC